MREERGWERRAGMILEVSLRNFMCHEVREAAVKMTSLLEISTCRYTISSPISASTSSAGRMEVESLQ